jgi:2-keto-4-pentenoate hydratase/2-oxohepta-3-ene-1,7-dioic acid hydratase in catechol pathway
MATVFRLAAIERNGEPRPVVLVEDRVIDVQDALNARKISAPRVEGRLDVLPMLDDWDNWLPVLKQVAEAGEPAVSSAGVRFLAPIRYPRKLLMAGANYSDHMAEMGGEHPTPETGKPFFFTKPPTTSIIGPGEPVVIPAGVNQADWEAELVAIVGRPARKVKKADGLNCIAGYTILNDVSSRDRQARKDWKGPFMFDWMLGKAWQGFAPMGPSITPAEFIADPYDLRVMCTVNGELMQNGSTRNFIFNIHEMVEYLSELFLLEPGDCISTGTPAGVGRPRGIFLKDGDTVITEVEGVCRMETPIRAER